MKKKIFDIDLNKSQVLLPGRHPCECQAAKHKLINNCLNCGRVVCAQEGSGPCFFCKNLVYFKNFLNLKVCSLEEQEILDRKSHTSDKLLLKLMSQSSDLITPALRKAIDNKNKLLNFDRLSAMRTQVIDDQGDYFTSNTSSWLSPSQKMLVELKEKEYYDKKHESKFNKPKMIGIKVDYNADEIVINEGEDYTLLPELSKLSISKGDVDKKIDLKNLDLKFKLENKEKHCINENTKNGYSKTFNRVQDDELLSSFDQKKCLCMHQPYASLLIFGIKKEEGRTWYTNHRGRLWIAATSKSTSPTDIKNIENVYKTYFEQLLGKENANQLRYPSTYPTGVLLGCINIDDCLTQERFRESHPDGLSESPFVWICSEPKKLKFNIPILGKPKIFDLDPQTWRAASKNLIYEETS